MATILFVSAVGGHGGPVVSLLDILPAFSGHTRVVAGSWNRQVFPTLAELCEVAERIPRPRGRAAVETVWEVRKLIRKHRPDVVFANGLTEVAVAAMAMTGLGAAGQVPIHVWVHNYELPNISGPARGLVRRKNVHWSAVSTLAADLAKNAGLADDVQLIANPINPEEILADRVPGQGVVRVAYLGTDRPYKGFDFLADTIERCRDLPVGWRLFAYRGVTEHWAGVDRLAESLDVETVGRVHPVSKAYAQADIVFIPSRQESFCRVAAEAMANGIPVVASHLQPLEGLLGSHQDAGLLVPVGDTAGYASAIRTLVEDPELRARLGRAGVQRASQYGLKTIHAAWRERIAL